MITFIDFRDKGSMTWAFKSIEVKVVPTFKEMIKRTVRNSIGHNTLHYKGARFCWGSYGLLSPICILYAINIGIKQNTLAKYTTILFFIDINYFRRKPRMRPLTMNIFL